MSRCAHATADDLHALMPPEPSAAPILHAPFLFSRRPEKSVLGKVQSRMPWLPPRMVLPLAAVLVAILACALGCYYALTRLEAARATRLAGAASSDPEAAGHADSL